MYIEENESTHDKQLFISVIIMAFNRRYYIKRAIESVLSQTLDKSQYEIIVMKNFEDAAIESYSNNYSNFSVVNFDSNGTFLNLPYLGMAKAKGDIACFLDDDDVFFPNKLEIIRNTFNQYPNVGFVHNSFKVVDEDLIDIIKPSRNIIYRHPKKDYRISNNLLRKQYYKVLKLGGLVNSSSISLRTCALPNLSREVENLSGLWDEFMFYWSMESGYDGLLLAEKLTFYGVHDSNNSKAKSFSEFIEYLTRTSDSVTSMKKLFTNQTVLELVESNSLYYCVKKKIAKSELNPNLKELLNLISSFVRFRLFSYPSIIVLYLLYLFLGYNYYRFLYGNNF